MGTLRKFRCGLMMLAGGVLAAGCAGPRMQRLYEEKPEALAPNARVDVYVGRLSEEFEPVAILDSDAYPYVDDDVKLQMLEELKARSRKLGGNTLHEVRILPLEISGFTTDERVPFTAWKQGTYQLYFMRAESVIAATSEPAALSEVEPEGGWIVDGMETPRRLTAAGEGLPMPGLQTIDVPTTEPERVVITPEGTEESE